MKKLLCLVPLSILISGCVAAGYPMAQGPAGYPVRPAAYPRPMRFQAGGLPIGRWDNVMMLAPGSTVQVLMADGAVATGAVSGASIGSLRVRVASGDVDLAATDVMRVDRLKAPGASAVRDGVEGAAWGAGIVGVAGLIVGRMPPPRLFAAGAVIGANQSIQFGRMGPDSVTIYLSPAVATGARPGVH
jgi:hypothetical protein